MTHPTTSVIILSWNGRTYLDACLTAVLRQSYPDFEVIVVDNGSTDGSADLIADRFPHVQLIRNESNLGFAAGNNVGLRAATGDVLALLNQDTVVLEGWLAALVDVLDDPTVGIVGGKLLYPDGRIQHAGAYLDGARGESVHIGRYEPDSGQHDRLGDVDFVTGASIALRRSTLARVGLLDEGFAPAYYEDTDWCYSAREAGLRVVYQPAAVVIHYESTSVETTSYVHKAVYHYGRLRLLFKHKPLSWLRQECVPAEIGWAARLGRTVEMMAARDAYLHLLLSLPEIAAFRMQPYRIAFDRDPPREWDGLLELVCRLRDACGQELPPPQDRRDAAALVESDIDELVPEHLRDTLRTKWQLKEQPFRSDVPLVGRGIAAFREAWNNVSTRWYVLPLLQQQTVFNAAVLNWIDILTRHLDEQRRDAAQSIREIDRLAQALARLERRMDELEKKMGENT